MIALSKNVATSKTSGFRRLRCRSRRSPIRFQVPAELAIGNDSLLRQINDWRIVAISHRRQVTPGRMATPVIVPVRRAAKDVIKVPLARHAKTVEHFVLERLHHPLDMRLQVR